MRARTLLAVLPALALMPAVPAHAATHGKVVAAYTRASNAAGQDVITWTCIGAGVGVTSYSCVVAPYLAVVVAPSARGGSVIAGPDYTLTVHLSVRDLQFTTYSCTKLLAFTAGTGTPAGELDCTA
jgi:hypothetical protein